MVIKNMYTKELVDIIVPVYNVEKYITDCVQSILAQTYTNFELLLVDDGSPDISGNICDEFALADARVRVLHQKNGGVSRTRNAGLENCNGKYVVFVDADDTVGPCYLENLLEDMVPGGMTTSAICNSQLLLSHEKTTKKSALSRQQAIESVFCNGEIKGFAFGKTFDLDLIRKYKIVFDEEIAICEDMLFVVEYLSRTTEQVVKVNATDYYYRDNENGTLNGRFTSTKVFDPRWLNEFEAFEKAETYLVQMPQARAACQMRKTKAAITTLRTMTANHYVDDNLYKKLLSYARNNLGGYLSQRGVPFSSKISMLCGCINPELEFWVYNTSAKAKKKKAISNSRSIYG